jgi:hypothetical protein
MNEISQIFNSEIPLEFLLNYLQLTCQYNNIYNTYIYDYISYKKSLFKNLNIEFLNNCKPYYKNNKKKYTDINNISFNGIITIIRQICNYHNIKYKKDNIYIKSKAYIYYHIYIQP